jgi:hypothetical protein
MGGDPYQLTLSPSGRTFDLSWSTPMNRSFRSAVAFAALTLVVGCEGCRTQNQTQAVGEPRYTVEVDGVNVEASEVDFGIVPMTKRVEKVVVVTNIGRGALQLDSFTKEGEGPAIQIGTSVVEPNAVFGVDLEATEIPPGESKELKFFFLPPEDASRPVVDHEVTLKTSARNVSTEAPAVQLKLKGRAIRGECEFPTRIDFGAVSRGDTFEISQLLKNRRMVDSFPRVGDIQSAQGAEVFTLTADSPRGDFTLAPGRERAVKFVFTPTEVRDYTATLKVLPADGCPEVTTRLVGTGVDNVLLWQPGILDFGYVQPGVTVTAELTFLNRGFKPVQLSGLATREGSNPSNIYRVVAANMGDATRLTVPVGRRDIATNDIIPGEAKVTVSFRPAVLGPRNGTLVATTDLRSQASVTVPLRGFGGGPDIDVIPAQTLNFGRIAYFAGSTSAATRKLTVRNVGTAPAMPDPRANLRLGAMGAGRPYFTVTPKNAESAADEICVGAYDPMAAVPCTGELPTSGPGAYNPAVGLVASGAAATLDIPVRVQPKNLTVNATSGNKEWEIAIFSNDPDEPEVRLSVTARPVMLPPCEYTLTPASLNYGVVSPPNNKDLTFQVCNVAPATATGNICLISNLDMGVGSDPMYSLPAGAVAEKELAPQQCETIRVRAWPMGALPATPTTATGSVAFNISTDDPARANPRVMLTATLAPSCLVISPSSLDFGTVQQGCNSPDRTFQVYNACPQPVRWVSASMIASGDTAMPGTMNCSGSAACTEFNVVTNPSTASLPPCSVGGASGPCINQGGSPLTFQLKYRPVNTNTDSGAYRIQVVQGNQQVDYVVTLTGRGDTMGFNTDTFSQDARPKADILIVIDNSGSMSDEQMALGANFNSFIQYAVTSQVDFQIAVTTTDADDEASCPNCEAGDFCRAGGATGGSSICANGTGPKIITPNTPNLQPTFAALVNVGTNGSATETCVAPAVRALTAPKITDPAKNAGFLRPDAVLAVVCVSDESEQANQPMSFYINQLLNIKGVQRGNLFSYNVIGAFTALGPGCFADDQGGRHAQLVAATNGLREEICTPNWATALENIGKGAFGFRTTFFLNGVPAMGNQVEVAIDGQMLPPLDGRGARVWRYDSAINAVIFEPLYVPEPGKTLTISYRVACL